MSLFGSIMGDLDDDPFFGAHMRSMRQMNNMMNSLFADPFGMMGGFGMGGPPALTMGSRHSMVPFGFPPMPQLNMNRLLSGSLDSGLGEHGFSSSSVMSMSMTSGPDGRPQVIQSSSSTRTGPGGIRETKRTHIDSRSGTKKMAIGHHIGSRSHVIEREQNTISGDQEERQEFINLEEEEAEDFNREFEQKARESFHGHSIARRHSGLPQITSGSNATGAGGWRSRISAGSAGGNARRSLRTPSPNLLALPAPVSGHHSPRTSTRMNMTRNLKCAHFA
ncbi:myeloid leukemia factor-like isoform X1 [Ctenocephalides felis]|uniref:myeloid leukemia factor-like isoform X2 n=1 Tax=Ctenocephalides felis TaxID=7515 RepID=UPI000E6E134E|nr:myeloid leukemia factor-like isoform X2 [Ctenocephalides felis]XP_026475220.1 myeloid leukemia factor-like isoform X1 [Ctenocephalides felis]